jgi:GNAT superfamily N-acetyltransferase
VSTFERFHYTSPTDPLARPLLDELRLEYDTRYADVMRELGESGQSEIDRYPAELFTPTGGGNFVLLLRAGQAIAGGAFKRHDDAATAEFKRIWTRHDLRRQGLARRVLVELEAQAWRQGYKRVYLTTGFRQPEAVGLYLGSGYTALFDRQADPAVLLKLPFEKQLTPPAPVRSQPQQQEATL